jgi:hypothetical protein
VRCIYADPANPNQFNQSDSGVLAQMYLPLSKSGQSLGTRAPLSTSLSRQAFGILTGLLKKAPQRQLRLKDHLHSALG